MGSGESKEDSTIFDTNLIYFDKNGNPFLDDIDPIEAKRRRKEEFEKIGKAELDFEIESNNEKMKEIQTRELNVDPSLPPQISTDKIYYLVDSPWIETWLCYTHFSKGVAPRPSPCSNLRLLVKQKRDISPEQSSENKSEEKMAEILTNNPKYIYLPQLRPGLKLADSSNRGDFRKVSQKTWETFVQFYEGSGPSIKMTVKHDGTHLIEVGDLSPFNPPTESTANNTFLGGLTRVISKSSIRVPSTANDSGSTKLVSIQRENSSFKSSNETKIQDSDLLLPMSSAPDSDDD